MESMVQPKEIEGLIPHDSSLIKVEVSWAESICRLYIRIAQTNAPESAIRVVEFTDLKEAVIPHNNPWGSSVSVNSATKTSELYNIEMQSGDTIGIKAGGLRVTYL
ncbi:hypothetical protein [Ectopseudomonas mendocina]|uniref:hypothetical protein n=1 Tax=Ectopseudomonas mendocina TaxID=300 RepID=UPI00131A6052|nr:hypothetical protein [Pseudomonas mendocina]